MKTQQTPNPAAQFPKARPPLFEHSVEVKHVPFLLLSDDVQPSFLKVTTLKSEKTEMKTIENYLGDQSKKTAKFSAKGIYIFGCYTFGS